MSPSAQVPSGWRGLTDVPSNVYSDLGQGAVDRCSFWLAAFLGDAASLVQAPVRYISFPPGAILQLMTGPLPPAIPTRPRAFGGPTLSEARTRTFEGYDRAGTSLRRPRSARMQGALTLEKLRH